MTILGYGEDSLTLWAIKSHLNTILENIADDSDTDDCIVYFRPSFGRSGGELSSQFGEFDFIIITTNGVYLGESKWDNSSELKELSVNLRDEQILRHKLFSTYIKKWLQTNPKNWEEFSSILSIDLKNLNISKHIAPFGSLLQENIQSVLENITNRFKCTNEFRIQNILLYLHNNVSEQYLPKSVNSPDFKLVCLDYSSILKGHFIDFGF